MFEVFFEFSKKKAPINIEALSLDIYYCFIIGITLVLSPFVILTK